MLTPVAQYVRMSTVQQPLSISIQMAAISAYAQKHGMEVVRTYSDEGRSGLKIDGRDGMRTLLRDVLAVPRRFDKVLVFDVSRWGRYLDVDESAYYEYHCRKHGVAVIYVAEHFTAEMTPFDSLLKQLKRTMAAEYSRELGAKCRSGQVETVKRGFATGQLPCLGYRRQSVSQGGDPGKLLGPHERKPMATDRVRWVLGPPEEVATVQKIFREYADGVNLATIARRLKAAKVRSHNGSPVTVDMIKKLVRSSVVLGTFSWGHRSKRRRTSTGIPALPQPATNTHMVDPIIDPDTWASVQQRIAAARKWFEFGYDDELLLNRLREVLARHPDLSYSKFARYGLPQPATYIRHFGSVTAAYVAAGRDDPTERVRRPRQALSSCIGKRFTSDVFDLVAPHAESCRLERRLNLVCLDGAEVKVRVAKACRTRASQPYWFVDHLERTEKVGRWLLILCLNHDTPTGNEFVLLPPNEHTKFSGRLTTKVLERFAPYRIGDAETLRQRLLQVCTSPDGGRQLALDL
ncbi:recombinase family protein [Ramlibacter albus]|uniref:Recombinase family protein n=1 Tax=Ramlibacter albus TaxID=2079448 RepID=A0A923M7T7_9BURK|nr:recombinase family protein [Ramlibacter albus]MBC5764147.1 recombinase family protein [Ramlibacter albus]